MSPENEQALQDAEHMESRELPWQLRACVGNVVEHVRRLVAELEGERKAKELALKGLESVTELYDAKKHEVRQLQARVEELERELKLWRPLTPEEAEQALNDAQAVPISEEVFARILAKATDPAERVTNNEAAQMAARIAELEAALKPFADRSEECRRIADVVAGDGRPCSVQPVPLEWLIRSAELLERKEKQ